MTAPESIDLEFLAVRLRAAPDGPRRLIAIAGPPAAGKSTVAAILVEKLNRDHPVAVAMGMDGFHYDDAVLDQLGRRDRKGAPDTFDLAGLRVAIERLRRDDGETIAVPVFDRSIETARAGAQLITPSARIVVIEGNYLLLRQSGWQDLHPLFDVTVLLAGGGDVLQQRLMRRWLDLGHSRSAATAKVEGNDLVNADLVVNHSATPHYTVGFGTA